MLWQNPEIKFHEHSSTDRIGRMPRTMRSYYHCQWRKYGLSVIIPLIFWQRFHQNSPTSHTDGHNHLTEQSRTIVDGQSLSWFFLKGVRDGDWPIRGWWLIRLVGQWNAPKVSSSACFTRRSRTQAGRRLYTVSAARIWIRSFNLILPPELSNCRTHLYVLSPSRLRSFAL